MNGFTTCCLEALFEVDHVVGDAEVLRDEARVVDVVERAAAAGCAAFGHKFGEPPLVPKLHGEADDLVAAALQQACDDGAIHSARHGDGDDGRQACV